MPQVNDRIKKWERLLFPEKPTGEPKTVEEWISLVRKVDRAFNGHFGHNYRKPHYSAEEKEQILSLRTRVQKLVEESG